MIKKIAFLGILVLLLGFFYSLGKQIYDSLEVSNRLDQETEQLVKLQQKNNELKKKLAEVGTINFIEQQARDKLNQARPNETVIIIPPQEIDKILGAQKEKIAEVIPNWSAWLKLFFHD